MEQDRGPRPGIGWALLLASVGLALFRWFPSDPVRPPAPGGAPPRHARGPAAPRLPRAVRPAPVPHGFADTGRPPAARVSGRAESRWALRRLVSRVKRTRAITAEDAAYIRRFLDDLRRRGAGAVPAIQDILRGGENVELAQIAGGDLGGHRTLRQAMIDTLARIGGAAATAASLEELQRTTDPVEVFMLARIVEQEEPGAHGDRVIQAVGTALQWAARAPAEAPDVGPLFDLLRGYRDERSVALLERSAPRWGEYALLALAGLPDGAGVPSLTALAAGADGALANRALPFQVLAQASTRYAAAGDALVELARAGEISDEAWGAMAEALEGRHLRFSGRMFDGTPLAEEREAAPAGRSLLWRSYYVEWLNVHYEEDLVSAGWSAEQVARQLAVIDDLSEVASSPTAVQALQQARTALLHARGDDDRSVAGG